VRSNAGVLRNPMMVEFQRQILVSNTLLQSLTLYELPDFCPNLRTLNYRCRCFNIQSNKCHRNCPTTSSEFSSPISNNPPRRPFSPPLPIFYSRAQAQQTNLSLLVLHQRMPSPTVTIVRNELPLTGLI
jgi:hypothetical protein